MDTETDADSWSDEVYELPGGTGRRLRKVEVPLLMLSEAETEAEFDEAFKRWCADDLHPDTATDNAIWLYWHAELALQHGRTERAMELWRQLDDLGFDVGRQRRELQEQGAEYDAPTPFLESCRTILGSTANGAAKLSRMITAYFEHAPGRPLN